MHLLRNIKIKSKVKQTVWSFKRSLHEKRKQGLKISAELKHLKERQLYFPSFSKASLVRKIFFISLAFKNFVIGWRSSSHLGVHVASCEKGEILHPGPVVIKLFMLNSAEHEVLNAHKNKKLRT